MALPPVTQLNPPFMFSGPTTAFDVNRVPFEFRPRTQLIFGCGAFSRLGEIAREHGGTRVLLVTDAGLREAGHSDGAQRMLWDSGLDVAVFDSVSADPTTEDVDRCVEFARGESPDLIVGLGGGSSMDCAKGANFLLTNGGQMRDYRGVGRARHPMLPMVAVPTTAGTGSEAQSFAVIADPATHMKMPCGDSKASCRTAILDPELTLTMPRAVATATGVDAMTHAVESFVTKRRNPVSQMFARQAWSLLATTFPVMLETPNNLEARGKMQLGAWFAGAAIENSMLGAAHAMANPLTAKFRIVHGEAVGVLLPHVIRWNAATVAPLYHDLAVAAGWLDNQEETAVAADVLADGFTRLLQLAKLPVTLTEAIRRDDVAQNVQTLAKQAVQQWTGTFNPRKMDEVGFQDLYRCAFGQPVAGEA